MALFDEHTWGASNPWERSLDKGDSGENQWFRKAGFAYTAEERIDGLLRGGAERLGILARGGDDTEGEPIAVFNPNSWDADGPGARLRPDSCHARLTRSRWSTRNRATRCRWWSSRRRTAGTGRSGVLAGVPGRERAGHRVPPVPGYCRARRFALPIMQPIARPSSPTGSPSPSILRRGTIASLQHVPSGNRGCRCDGAIWLQRLHPRPLHDGCRLQSPLQPARSCRTVAARFAGNRLSLGSSPSARPTRCSSESGSARPPRVRRD